MSSNAIDAVFLASCKEIPGALTSGTLLFPDTTLVSLSPTPYDFTKLRLYEDEVTISEAERLSAFYPNAVFDFYGTPSGALCVYKTGAAWPVRTGPESQRYIRETRSVHDHPMQATWPELGERVCSLLDSNEVHWTSIDPLAFADAGEERFSPLLIWIGVEPKSLTYELANTAASAITMFLTEAGFSDFEIGFRESIVTHSISGPKMLAFDPSNDSIPEFRKSFTPTLGLSIASLKTPHFEGTGALYLRIDNRVVLLTCAHVARPPPANIGMARPPKRHRHERIIALGSFAYNNTLKSMMSVIGDLDFSIKNWRDIIDRLGEPKEGEDERITKRRDEHLGLVGKAREKIDVIYGFFGEMALQWSIPDQRVIGKVLHVGPSGVDVAPHRFTRDWALIELYDKKFDWTTFPGNKIYVGGNLSWLDYVKLMFPRPEDRVGHMYPNDGLLQVSGVVQPEDIRNPSHLDAHDDQCLLVVKNGMATGTTVGRVNGMESFVRVYDECGVKQTSMEIAVLPYGRVNGPFSAPGDSGSVVLDRDGGIVGMITRGAGAVERMDVTYVTPYWWLEREIKKCFPDACLYEVV